MDWLTSLFGLGTAIVVALVTATVTVRLALKRFYAEKWWERKSAAYASIIEALHHVRNHADTNLAFAMRGKDVPEQGDRELTEKLQGAMAELRKQLDVGDFVLSEEAVGIMNTLMTGLDASTSTGDWQVHLTLKLDAVNTCLSNMRRVARKDLRLE